MVVGGSNLRVARSHANRCAASATDSPYVQGHLDGLCGLYSAINAVAAVLAPHKPLRGAQATKLFRHGLEHIASVLPLTEAVSRGVETDLWLSTIKLVAALAAENGKLSIVVERPFAAKQRVRFDDTRRCIETVLDQHGVALVSLVGVYDHYTVITAHTPTRFLLRDSSGLHAFMKRACGSDRSTRRHKIDATWLITLRVKQSRARVPS